MTRAPRRSALAAIFAAVAASPAGARQADTATAPPFGAYSVIQYATTTGRSPRGVLSLDDNGDLVLAARGGITRGALRRSLRATESQIALLETFRLLQERHDTLITAFPILTPTETRRLRRLTDSAAAPLAERLAPHVRALVQQLAEGSRADGAYTILFSYVLDGLVWDAFERRGLVSPLEIGAESPLWAGEIWAVYPARRFQPGTNTLSDGGVALKVCWTEEALPHMRPFVADIPTLGRLLEDYRKRGGVTDTRVRDVFGSYDLFDGAGRVTVPVLTEQAGDPLYQAARGIAERVAIETPVVLDLEGIVRGFGLRDRRQALVLAYHELMWGVLERLEATGIVRRPRVLAAPDRAEPKDVAALVFIVREAP